MSTWLQHREQINKAQQKQKRQHDKHVRDPDFKIGDRVFVYIPASRQGEGYKFSKPFDRPFKALSLFDNGAELKNINKPRSKVIRVALNKM